MSHILVAYASKHGSTAGIAAAITQALNACGLDATCADASSVKQLDRYDAVILGSAVYARRWRPEARRFLRHHADALAERPFWVFSSGPVGDPVKDDPSWAEPPRTIAKAVALGAREHVVFGGSVSLDGGKLMRAMLKGVPPEFRDRRDWDAIRAWAEAVADALCHPEHEPRSGCAAVEHPLGTGLRDAEVLDLEHRSFSTHSRG